MLLKDVVSCLDNILEPWKFKDYCPNGLQVEGRGEVRKVLTGVTASLALIEEAISRQADAILVHHGYFWKGEDPCLVGMKRKRIELLLEHGISLIAYHLPLDAHALLGNNAQLAQVLGLQVQGQLVAEPLVWHGTWPQSSTAADFANHASQCLGRPVQLLGCPDAQVKTMAWCTGGAQNFFDLAIQSGVDAFLTGEVSEQHFHMAKESGIAFFAAGHHATEQYGVKALGGWLAAECGLDVEYFDLNNPV